MSIWSNVLKPGTLSDVFRAGATQQKPTPGRNLWHYIKAPALTANREALCLSARLCLLCSGAPINSGSWPFQKLHYMLLTALHCLQSGRSSLNIIAFSRQTKTRMWLDRYLADKGIVLLRLVKSKPSLKMWTVCEMRLRPKAICDLHTLLRGSCVLGESYLYLGR